jgi:hypothetical protein
MKRSLTKLPLYRETLRRLETEDLLANELAQVHGGTIVVLSSRIGDNCACPIPTSVAN